MIRFGVIGTNSITEKFIKSACQNDKFQLNAVYSRTSERGKEFALKYGVDQVYTSLDEMAQSSDIDAVYIASPNSCHGKQSLIFLENNKHVLCEKTIASNLKELDVMIASAKKNKVLLMEAMITSFLPNFKSIKDNMHKIGKIRRYYGTYCQYSSRYDKYKNGENPNTFNPEFSNGSIMDIGIYCIYPLIQLFGEPKSITAKGVLLDSGVDGEGSILLEYDDMDAVITHSKIANSALSSEIQGELGQILINQLPLLKEININYRNGDIEDINICQDKLPMYYELTEFINLIESGKTESDINTYEISRIVMNVLETSRKQMGVLFPCDID